MRRYAIALLLTVLAGCLPYATWRYYEPSAPGGTLDGTLCGGRVGPHDELKFNLGGGQVSVFAFQHQERLRVSMSFRLPQGYVGRLLDHDVRVRPGGVQDTIAARFGEITVTGSGYPVRKIAADEPMIGASRPGFRGSSRLLPQGFMTTAEASMTQVESFVATFPRFAINDQPASLPTVTFTRKRYHAFFLGINC